MAVPRRERRLVAILVADVVGYSRLMGRDETGTLARVRRCRCEVLEPLLVEHCGRMVNFRGDNALCEFASVVDAVACAVAVQRRLAERERDLPEPLRFRIGINLGDVVIEEGDLNGDGVNIAARLEQLAEPGGVAISGATYDHVRGKLNCEYDYLGERRLKNIEQPVRVYRVGLGGITGSLPHPAVLPAIAVLPFANVSSDPDQEYFGDGIADDLITDLAKISGLFVASRHSAFALKGVHLDVREAGSRLGVRYVLEGSIRKVGDRLRVTAQLIDAETGGHLWAERYDRILGDVFAVQDEITRSIVGVLKIRLLPREEVALRRPPTSDIDAYGLYLRGQQLCRLRSRHDFETARRLFAQAVELDPAFARAYAGIAECNANLCLQYGCTLFIEEALAAVAKALELEPDLAVAHVAHGLALVALGELTQAEHAFDRAIASEPEHFGAHYAYARIYFERGRMEDAARLFRRAMKLNPDDMYAPITLLGLERSHGWLDQAVATARVLLERAQRALERRPENARAAFSVGAALETLGDRDGAMRFSARALALAPDDHPVCYNVACNYAKLGEVEMALDLLERTMPGASAHRWAWLAQDTDFDSLREHPRFKAMLRQHGPRL